MSSSADSSSQPGQEARGHHGARRRGGGRVSSQRGWRAGARVLVAGRPLDVLRAQPGASVRVLVLGCAFALGGILGRLWGPLLRICSGSRGDIDARDFS